MSQLLKSVPDSSERTRVAAGVRRDEEVALVARVVHLPLLDEVTQGRVNRLLEMLGPVGARPVVFNRVAQGVHISNLISLLQPVNI